MSAESPKKKKTLKEIEMPKEALNCGLEALSKVGNLKNVSAFTLVHLGRDNGMNLQVFKVLKDEDLVRVVRPAIFHQKDHFVYVGKDEVLPKGEYTGHVIGLTPLGRVISLSESKFITGGKNFFTGQNKDGEQKSGGALQVIATVVASVGGFLIGGPAGAVAAGSAVNTGYGAVVRAQNPAELGEPGDLGKIGIDAVVGGATGLGVGGGAAGVAAGGAKQSIPTAVSNFSKGAFQAISHPISTVANGLDVGAAGIAGAGSPANIAAFNAASGGASNAAGASSAGINAGANAVKAFSSPSLASQTASFGGGVSNSFNAAGGVSALPQNIGTFTPSSFVNNAAFDTSQFTLPPNLQTGAAKVAGAAPQVTSGGGGFGGAIDKAISSNPIGSAATLAGAVGLFGSKAPAYEDATPTENYSAVSQFLGPNALAKSTDDQLTSYINTPIEDLAKTFTSNSTRVSDAINKSYDNQKQGLVHQFAQAGQNLSNSSELQQKVSELEQKRSTDLSNAALEVQNAGVSQAIQVKQQALSQGMQSGQFNQALAMQLANLTGDQQNLQYAIANNDYQSFQQIMGKLLTMGIPQNVKLTV